ncbi:hypothetical protein IWW54_003327, partial [Coemansia sp. RSA 2705]
MSSQILEPTPELSRKLHEKVVDSQAASSLVNRLASKNKDLQTQSVSTYQQFWKDSENNNEQSRTTMYKTLTNTYYNLATDFYEYGWGESFHFARKSISESLRESIKRHEHLLFDRARIQPNMK